MKPGTRCVLATLILTLGVALSGCAMHGSGRMHVHGPAVSGVVYTEPPPPRNEVVTVREGHVWVNGRWNWQNGQWVWAPGYWEVERVGHRWESGRWERRGNAWHWIEGRWATVDASGSAGGVAVGGVHGHHHDAHHQHGGHVHQPPHVQQPPHPPGGDFDASGASGGVAVGGGGAYPTSAPPPLRQESYGPARPGFIWVSGRWDWNGGRWIWVDGHWERQRANQVWISGRWELRGGRWVWTAGRWDRR